MKLSDEQEIKVAAAAVAGIVSPPLGAAVAIGAALRSPRVRQTLRAGTVRALGAGMRASDEFARRASQNGRQHHHPET